jgi:ferritin-like metal-binding protein YciE
MKLTSEHLKTLHSLYIAHLKKALDMEREITKALPKMVDKSTTPELANAFRSHLKETEGHVSRIEQISSGRPDPRSRRRVRPSALSSPRPRTESRMPRTIPWFSTSR